MNCVAFLACLVLTLSVGCQPSNEDPPAPKKSPTIAPVCPQALEARGFADPAAAYTRYADAINASNWCEAIAAFDPKSRPTLVLMTFKGLVLLGGTDNPKRLAYQQNILEFCEKHKLPYSPSGFAALTAKLLKQGNADAELGAVKQAATANPEAMYVDLLQRLKQVDSHTMMKLDPSLRELTITGDTAAATSSQRDGRTGAVAFVKTNNGWLLTAR